MPTILEVYDDVTRQMGTIAGLTESPDILDPSTAPSSRADRIWSVDLPGTDEDQERSKARSRVGDDLTVTYAKKIAPKKQRESYRQALTDENVIFQAMLTKTGTWQEKITVRYENTARELIESREWLFIVQSFAVFGYREYTT